MSLSKPICSFALGAGLLILTSVSASAQEGAGGQSDLPAICTDRPTKSNFACTVEAGHFQHETDLFNVTRVRDGAGSSDTWLILNPTLKYGIAPGIDIEANFSPSVIVRSQGASGVSEIAGPGDLTLRLKYQIADWDGSRLQAALLPYIKAPS